MAHLSHEIKYVKKEVVVTKDVPVREFNLKLSLEELHCLKSILQQVGGPQQTSPRKYSDSILHAVKHFTDKCGYQYSNSLFDTPENKWLHPLVFKGEMELFNDQVANYDK